MIKHQSGLPTGQGNEARDSQFGWEFWICHFIAFHRPKIESINNITVRFINNDNSLCGWRVVLTSQGCTHLTQTKQTFTPHCVKQHCSSDETFSIETCFPLPAQALCYAKHVLLFWNVGSLMSINTEDRLLWSRLVGAAFRGVIVLGSGESTDRFWASNLHMERNQMICRLYSHQGQIPAGNI